MSDIPVFRRMMLAVTGVIVAGVLLRPQMSQALVVRGDDRLYRGGTAEALAYYRRAIETDPSNGAAVDRFAFGATGLRDRSLVREAIDTSSRYLRRHQNDDVVRLDRAMAFRLLRDWRQAGDDFARVGVRERDATALTFAGYAELAMGRKTRAIALWRRALTFDRTFRAARHALAIRVASR